MPRLKKDSPSIPKKEREPSVVNPRHKAVADALLEGARPSDAMRAAGYDPSSAQNVMRQETVQQLLAEARAEITDISTLRRIDVLNMFIEAIDMARTLADPAQMINGTDKVAKMMGFYAPEKIEISNGTASSMQAKYKQMTDEELYAILAERATSIEASEPDLVPASSPKGDAK